MTGKLRQLIIRSHKLFYSQLSLFKFILQNIRLLKGKGKRKEEGKKKKVVDLLLIAIKRKQTYTGAVQ